MTDKANDNVVLFSPAFDRTDMTPEQAIAAASLYQGWEEVIVAGYTKDKDGKVTLTITTSKMSRRDALWIAEAVKDHLFNNGE